MDRGIAWEDGSPRCGESLLFLPLKRKRLLSFGTGSRRIGSRPLAIPRNLASYNVAMLRNKTITLALHERYIGKTGPLRSEATGMARLHQLQISR